MTALSLCGTEKILLNNNDYFSEFIAQSLRFSDMTLEKGGTISVCLRIFR